jgi:hypothetical protein
MGTKMTHRARAELTTRPSPAGNIAGEASGNKCMVCPRGARSFLIESRHRHASMYPAC